MRSSSPGLVSRGRYAPRREPEVAVVSETPAPLQIFARLSLLLAIALGFGFAARILVCALS